jgi:hypothetical protein
MQFFSEMVILGESIKFWTAVAFASFVKFLFSSDRGLKVSIAGIISGMLCAYYGYQFVLKKSSFFDLDDKFLVVILLTLTGEHIVRWIIEISPEKLINLWRKK